MYYDITYLKVKDGCDYSHSHEYVDVDSDKELAKSIKFVLEVGGPIIDISLCIDL